MPILLLCSSLLPCPSCSVPLLLQEHSIHGLYPFHFLRRLAFGTKIEFVAADRCLTVTASSAKVFINGVEITKPDYFNNGLIIVHALQGFVSHLSPNSCSVESMTSLSFLLQRPVTSTSTLFAIDDESIFIGGGGSHAYLAELGFHIVPNRLLTTTEFVEMLGLRDLFCNFHRYMKCYNEYEIERFQIPSN